VHAVLTRRLPDRVLPQDLRSWSAAGAGRLDAIAHARHLAAVLAPDERAALLQWCQEVAAADGAVAAAEAELLQRFAEVLRTPRPVHSLAERE
ncbi:MAG: TerB family tellurite resistance protein, partial [Planctomycetota bacterium]